MVVPFLATHKYIPLQLLYVYHHYGVRRLAHTKIYVFMHNEDRYNFWLWLVSTLFSVRSERCDKSGYLHYLSMKKRNVNHSSLYHCFVSTDKNSSVVF